MKRRQFLSMAAGSAVSLFAGRTLAASHGSRPRLVFPERAVERIAVSSYPFRGQMVAVNNNRRDPKLPGMTVVQFADFVRAEYGLSAIEVLDKHFESTDAAYLAALRSDLRKRRMTLVNIPLDNKVQLCNGNAQEHEAGLALHRQWIDVAKVVGCPSVRMRMPVGADAKAFDEACAVDALRSLTAYAASRDVMLNIENDSPFNESSEYLRKVVLAVGSPFFRVLPDMANGLAGGDEAFNLREMQAIFPLAYNIAHAKSWETIGGVRKEIDLRAAVEVARKAGFRGWYSLESDSREDPRGDTHALLTALRGCLQ